MANEGMSARFLGKTCTKCGETKPISEFYPQKGGRGGVHSRCKSCESTRGKERYATVAGTTEYKTRQHQNRMLRQYGISDEDYEAMLEMQGFRCGICGSKDVGRIGAKRFAVDHSHESGKVRGLLCSRCNQALGLFGDNPEVLRKAAVYLERDKCRTRKKTPS